jgi:hypothetical protein
MSIASDLDKGVTFGEADGPDTFIDELGIVVPTFVDPRNDLIIGSAKYYKRVSHHVPFKMRGHFKAADWPEEFVERLRGGDGWRTDPEGFVICTGTKSYGKEAGKACRAKAVNRTRFCRCHGGGLHPLDKKMSAKSVVAPPENRVKALDRPQKFLQGFVKIDELTDEEVQGLFIYNDAGQKVDSIALGMKMHQQIAQELHRRMNRFLQTKTASMLNVMVDIAESELVEPADRIKAATWVAERTLGKTPDVVIHGTLEQPYETIFETIDAGSRENYRKEISSERIALEQGGSVDEIIDVQSTDIFDEDEESEEESESVILESVREADDRKAEVDRQQEIKKARAKAKQRRYAARAVGATTVHDMPWLIEWRFLRNGTFRMKLVCPDEQTEAKLDKVTKSNAKALEDAERWRNNATQAHESINDGSSPRHESDVHR